MSKIYFNKNIFLNTLKTEITCTLSPSLHIRGRSTILRSGPTCMFLSMYCTDPIPPVAALTWCWWTGSADIDRLQRNTVKVTSPFRMSKSQVITEPLWGTWIRTCVDQTSRIKVLVYTKISLTFHLLLSVAHWLGSWLG